MMLFALLSTRLPAEAHNFCIMILTTTCWIRSLSASGQMAEPFLVEFLLELMTGNLQDIHTHTHA